MLDNTRKAWAWRIAFFVLILVVIVIATSH